MREAHALPKGEDVGAAAFGIVDEYVHEKRGAFRCSPLILFYSLVNRM